MNGFKLWEKILDGSPKGSVIMGGAIVDSAVGIEPKDIDVFYSYVPGSAPLVPADWTPTDANFNDPAWMKEHEQQYLQGVGGNGNNPISSVVEYLVDGHRVQMIGVNYHDPRTHFLNFDHSLTLAHFSKRGYFIHRKVFESFDTDTVTYVSKNKAADAKAKSLVRAKNKIARYGGNNWNFIGFD